MKVFQISIENFKDDYLDHAITLLRKGEVISFPTDTSYILAADTYNQDAISKIYRIKNKPLDQPLYIIGMSKEDLLNYVIDWNHIAEKLSNKFWPGALTIIMNKSFKVPDYIVPNLDTIGIRVPNHPIAFKIIDEFGKPLTISSANINEGPCPTTGRLVLEELFDTELSLLLDAGKTPLSESSTIIDLSKNKPVLIREGAIKRNEIDFDFD
jgi:L-threonylcarbamoyladenylate synthase